MFDFGIIRVRARLKLVIGDPRYPGLLQLVWLVDLRCGCQQHVYAEQTFGVRLACRLHRDRVREERALPFDGPFVEDAPVKRISWPPLAPLPDFDDWYACRLAEIRDENARDARRVVRILARHEKLERDARLEPPIAPPAMPRGLVETARHMLAVMRGRPWTKRNERPSASSQTSSRKQRGSS